MIVVIRFGYTYYTFFQVSLTSSALSHLFRLLPGQFQLFAERNKL